MRAKRRKLQAASDKPQAYQINYDDFCKGDEEPQASSSKPRAVSIKLQAASDKLHNIFALIKSHVSRDEVLRKDKCIVRMFHVERDLVWRKCHTITLRYFQLYCKKVAITIITQ